MSASGATGRPRERVLVLAPFGRDADLIRGLLADAGLDARAVATTADVGPGLEEHTDVLVLTTEAVEVPDDALRLCRALDAQPSWSSIPAVALAAEGVRSDATAWLEEALGAHRLTVLERPVQPRTLLASVRLALRERSRQHEVRELLERREADARRDRERAERLSVTLRSIAEGVVTTDAEGRVSLLNPAAEDLLGLSAQQALHRPAADVVRLAAEETGERVACPVDEVLRTREVLRADAATEPTVLLRPDGGERVVSWTIAPIVADDRVAGAVLVLRDMTEQRELEAELARASKLDTVGSLAGGIAHNFNNALAVILGGVSMARLDVEPDSRARLGLDEAEEATLRAQGLTSRLLTFAKGGEPVRRLVEPGGLVREAASRGTREAAVHARIAVAEDLWPAKLDEGQVTQALEALVRNASEVTEAGGEVSITAENRTVSSDSDLPLPPGPYVHVAVADSGPGLSHDLAARIFEPFFSTKEQREGLGLTTAYSIVARHGGTITLHSEPGRGAVFHVHLPAHPEQREQVSLPARPRRHIEHHASRRVLVMDDDTMLRDMLGAALRRLDYLPELTQDGEEALEAYRRALDEGEPFAAVILDLSVPGGMGGKETMRRLLEIDPGACGVVSSGYSDDPVMSDPAAYGFAGVMPKPYRIRELQDVLEYLHCEP